MADLGTLGGTTSWAEGVSDNGATVVGRADIVGDAAYHAFRWTSGGGMADLGTLGGTNSWAIAISADGATVVGRADIVGDAASHAFRWTSGGGMVDLGTLGGTNSSAEAVSSNGTVVVGASQIAGDVAHRAFRWTSGGGMVDLGTLGGTDSMAFGVSNDGTVVVGAAQTGGAIMRAFRWTLSHGMQSVEDWLRDAGVVVPTDITYQALATNSDGSVVVGDLHNNHAFIARVSSIGAGLITLNNLHRSLADTVSGGSVALLSGNLIIHGAHSRPLIRRVATGQNNFWLAGDWGRDDHGTRDGDLGLAEIGFGRNFGVAQINVSLGHTWADQKQATKGSAEVDGAYLQAESLIPVSNNLWAVLGGYYHWGNTDLRRGYLNAGVPDFSKGSPDVDTWGLRARLEWDQAWKLGDAYLSPYADLSFSKARLDSYTEVGGGFPAHFNSRTEHATELHLGVNGAKPLTSHANLVGVMEVAHRFENNGARTSGEVIGLSGFDLDGRKNQQNWLRAGVGVEGKLAGGKGSLMLNATTRGEIPNAWLAANWQMAF
jgi:probable HAF family extracellular repeat protein